MMSLLEWLLGLEQVQLGRDAPLLLKWSQPFEAWMLFCVSVLAVALVALIYRREGGTAKQRTLLAVVRLALIALVVTMLCRPTIVLQRDRIEPAHVTILLDSSASMAATDRYDDQQLATHVATGAGVDVESVSAISRLALAQAALTRDHAAPLRALLSHNAVQLTAFDRSTVRLADVGKVGDLKAAMEQVNQIQPRGVATDIVGALLATLHESQGGRLAAIVLVTDGQASVSSRLGDALDAFQGRRVPVYPIRLGSPKPRTQVTVGPLLADPHVFQNDMVAISAKIEARGLQVVTLVTLLLTEKGQPEPLQRVEVNMNPAAPQRTVTLTTKATRLGLRHYRVRAVPLPHEQTVDDNADEVEVMVVKGDIHVLYVEGYPRYEYRFLKNALLREKTNTLSVLLLGADDSFVQEGTTPLRRFPQTPEELKRFDVVLLGDVDPRGGWLTRAQMNMLVDYVGEEGGGFGVIAGERFAPLRFAGTPLEKLLPVYIDPRQENATGATFSQGFRMQLTPAGRRSRLFRTIAAAASPTADPAQLTTLLESLPKLYWLAQTGGAKPGAIVLAHYQAIQPPGASTADVSDWPFLVLGRYGAGSVFFQASDDTWRWRRYRGEFLHDTYWVQVVRELAKVDHRFAETGLAIRTDRRTYQYGQPVQISVEVLDTKILGAGMNSISLEIREQISEADTRTVHFGDSADPTSGLVRRVDARRLSPRSNVFQASLVPPRAGNFLVTLAAPNRFPLSRQTRVGFRVHSPSLETRRLEADHRALEQIAAATGGQMIEMDQMESEFETIPDRSVKIPDDITEPLWDSRLVFILFLLGITTEWILRKVFGLA